MGEATAVRLSRTRSVLTSSLETLLALLSRVSPVLGHYLLAAESGELGAFDAAAAAIEAVAEVKASDVLANLIS